MDQGQPVATNVTKLALAGAAQDSAGTEQRMFYNKGVGTARFEHVLGGGRVRDPTYRPPNLAAYLARNGPLTDVERV
jgi:hypothetical protein